MRLADDPRPGDPRRSRHHPRHDPRRARSPQSRRRTRPGQRPARRLRQLRLTARAEADAWQQSAEAASPARRRRRERTGARRRLAAERQQLEAANACYEQWSAATTSTREAGAKARAELKRRGLVRQSPGLSQPQAANEPEAEITTVDAGASGANHQAARLDELLICAAAAAGRIAADRAGREARAGYAARVGREAQVRPEPALEVQSQYDAEMEL